MDYMADAVDVIMLISTFLCLDVAVTVAVGKPLSSLDYERQEILPTQATYHFSNFIFEKACENIIELCRKKNRVRVSQPIEDID